MYVCVCGFMSTRFKKVCFDFFFFHLCFRCAYKSNNIVYIFKAWLILFYSMIGRYIVILLSKFVFLGFFSQYIIAVTPIFVDEYYYKTCTYLPMIWVYGYRLVVKNENPGNSFCKNILILFSVNNTKHKFNQYYKSKVRNLYNFK